jgi:hypothetical protein
MRKVHELLFPIALTTLLAGCGGSAANPVPISEDTTMRSIAPQTSTIVWRAGDSTLGKWTISNSNQCGSPVNTSTTFSFTLNRSGTYCGRNQANPTMSSGSLLRLTDGATYTWTFNYFDGKIGSKAVGMGVDTDARSLIWQIHGYLESDAPCAELMFVNGPKNTGGPQRWGLQTCAGLVWTGTYSPGESDTFKIVARISKYSSGYTQLYRNGVLVASVGGANYHNSSGNPWWNFGPYKWRWMLSGGGGSNMYQVNATISNMTLTKS